MLHLRLEERLVDLDIATYVAHRLAYPPISSVAGTRSLSRRFPAERMASFSYAKLAMDAFLEEGADAQERYSGHLPSDLDVMYTGLLLRARTDGPASPDDLQLLILSWVTHATRPLRLLEIAEMIHVTQNTGANVGLKATKGSCS